jgi:hypothetical protein
MSHIGGYFYIGNNTGSNATPLTDGPLIFHSTALKYVVTSIMEAWFGAIFGNAKEGTVTCPKWCIHRMQLNSKLATTQSNKNSPKSWICASIVSRKE